MDLLLFGHNLGVPKSNSKCPYLAHNYYIQLINDRYQLIWVRSSFQLI
jgi:hypothetical protein